MRIRSLLTAIFMLSFCTGLPVGLAETAPSQAKPAPPAASSPASQSTYSNPDFHLRFSYPSDWKVTVSTAKPNFIILLLFKGDAKSAGEEDLRIDAYKDSKPGDENSDPDARVKANGALTLGGTTWQVFNEPLHPRADTIPIYALRKVQGSILYVVSALNATKLNPVQTGIVSSIHFE